MRRWKFLLVGVTGDLSRRKIFPALSEFANNNCQKIDIELIGYSRSVPDQDEISRILDQAYPDKKNKILKRTFVQGEYNDSSFFTKVFNELSDDERLIAYFAVPPQIFIDLLKIFCMVSKKNIDIIVEKPFGQDLDEAKKIIDKIYDCNLQERVHFCDHYLFKDGVNLNNNILNKLKKFTPENVVKIEIKALEEIGVEGRTGYFDKIGTIKDMIPAHFYSLWHILKKYNLIKLGFNDIVIDSLKIGQYRDYRDDVDNPKTNTETYFCIDGSVDGISVNFESGKKKSKKQTEIIITYSDSVIVRWNIDTERKIYIKDKVFNLNRTNLYDHANLFEDLLNKKFDRFLNEQDAINGWLFYEKIKKHIESTHPHLEIY